MAQLFANVMSLYTAHRQTDRQTDMSSKNTFTDLFLAIVVVLTLTVS